MQDLIVSIGAAWAGTSQLEIVSVLFGLVYVVLAARENIWCWPAAFIGTGTAVFLFWDASLVMESALNVYYLAMAIFGWWQWRAGGDNNSGLLISSLRTRQHLIAISLISVLTLVSGYLLSTRTTAALPYVDSFTTWSAVITTWMVARKILQNWLYWIVIDLVAMWLFSERGLYLYALLFLLYSLIAVIGHLQWSKKYLRQQKSRYAR
jgi:nicotinamide mononucleotide transporter